MYIKSILFIQIKRMSIKLFIVTLPEYSSRLIKLDNLRRDLSSIGLEPTIYNGVNGKDIILHATDVPYLKKIEYKNAFNTYDARVRTNGERMTKGELGCAWSHLNLLKQLLNEPAEVKYYLILEDDVELVKPLEELALTMQHMPEDMDSCHLAKSDWYPFTRTRQVNPFLYECAKAYFNRTTAYLISKKGAEKVLAYSNNYINIPIDDLYCTVYRETNDFRFYVPHDYFFKEQENVMSTIMDINSQQLQHA